MTELKRYDPLIDFAYSEGVAIMAEGQNGGYVSYEDALAYTQAAIAAAMCDVMHPIVYERFICESISKGDNGEVAKMAGVMVVVLDRITKAQYAAIESMKGPTP